MRLEGAPSVDVLLLGSAPPVGLLLGGELSAGLLRGWGAPPTDLVLGGAPPTGLLPGWELHLFGYLRGALSKVLRPWWRCLLLECLKGAPPVTVLPLGAAAAILADLNACPRDTAWTD